MHFIISSTGHGWREVQDEWDLPRLERWMKYCNKHPPLREMVQAYLRIESEEPMRVTKENFSEFMKILGVGGVLNG